MDRRIRRRRSAPGGFTLIELLVAVALMVILLGAVTWIFAGTTDTVAVQEARTTVFTNARYALDIMENDLLGSLSFDPPNGTPPGPALSPPPPPSVVGQQVGLQRFWMENGYAGTPGALPSPMGGHHTDQAGDSMGFRTTTTVGNDVMTCEVTYSLIPGNMCVGPSNVLQPGDDSHKQGLRTGRGLYTLLRKVRVADNPAGAGAGTGMPMDPKMPWTFNPQIKDPVTGTMVAVIDEEICHYVISFNLEYYANNQQFSQLDPSPFPQSNPAGQEPLPAPGTTATMYRVPAVRVTLVVVDDVGERQERTIQKEIWIPEG